MIIMKQLDMWILTGYVMILSNFRYANCGYIFKTSLIEIHTKISEGNDVMSGIFFKIVWEEVIGIGTKQDRSWVEHF